MPCFFMLVQYDFNDPLRGPWRFSSIHGCFNTIWIDWYFAFYHPVTQCSRSLSAAMGPEIRLASNNKLLLTGFQGRGDRRVYTYIIYIYIYIDCCMYIYIYVCMYLSIAYIITSSPQKRRAALPTTIIWLLKTDDWQTNFLTGTNHPSMVFKFSSEDDYGMLGLRAALVEGTFLLKSNSQEFIKYVSFKLEESSQNSALRLSNRWTSESNPIWIKVHPHLPFSADDFKFPFISSWQQTQRVHACSVCSLLSFQWHAVARNFEVSKTHICEVFWMLDCQVEDDRRPT